MIFPKCFSFASPLHFSFKRFNDKLLGLLFRGNIFVQMDGLCTSYCIVSPEVS